VPTGSTGQTLRTYRLALANTVEYANKVCGDFGLPVTVDNVLARMVITVNRVVGIYERDVAVRLVLIANNTAIINTTTDTYSNNDGFAMLGQNQSRINTVIGSANYDVGHVFSTGGGGVAGLGVICNNSEKAEGVTGSPVPYNDPFDVDYVAHEMGHQFGGNHTFNGCGQSQRNGPTAFEPGSGSTIQAYAGICGTTDLQPNSDPYFHGISIDEIINHTNIGGGNGCAVQTPTGNLPPIVDAGPAYTIPANTSFELTAGSAFDPDGDAVTYCWEEFDNGPNLGTLNTDNGSSPIIRSANPSTSPTRSIPRIANLIANTTWPGEIRPTTNRTMTFRLTVRDNRAGGGGVANDSTTVTSSTAAGPFSVTAPNTATTVSGGSALNVTWNVANTNTGAVNTPNAMILLSVDGGNTFPIVLRASTPNDGSESVTLPNVATTQARIKVKGAGNIFFDISNANFTITSAVTGGDSPGIYLGAIGFYFQRNSNSSGDANNTFGFGPSPSTAVPIVGDWDGNHTDTPAIYDPVSGFFFLRNSNGAGPADTFFGFGPGGAGIVPLKGDWNGDGIDTIGIYNAALGVFFLRNSNSSGPADIVFGFGPSASTLVPVTGDWNGDLRDTIGLYDPTSGFFFLRNENVPGPADLTFSFGAPGATPLVGDWNLDGRDTVGIYLPASGFWFVRNSNTSGGADVSFGYGPSNATPITGDWDGL
jgi:hypothetical protein